MQRYFSRKLLVVLIFAVFVNFFYFYSRFQKLNNTRFFEELKTLTSRATGYCRLPLDLDPFDPKVKRFIVKLPEIKCLPSKSKFDYKQILTFVDDDGVLRTKNSSFALNCEYIEIFRNATNEDKVIYGHKKKLPSSLDMNSLRIDFVSVECYDSNNASIYNNTHFYPSSVEPKITTTYKPSVIVMVIESMSRLNYLRFLHETKRELESLPDVFYMQGMTKIADNSYPNMVPFLTGLRANSHEFPKGVKEGTGPFDEMPFVWKLFEENNYTTALVEDDPWYTMFNYIASGFRKQPTNWYPRPYWVHIYNENKLKRFGYCYNKETRHSIFQNQLKSFILKMKDSPFFLFNFLIEVTHNDFNRGQSVDTSYASFIREFKQQINDSVFILMGDHGARFGNILSTFIGRVEERMPLFAIHLPQRLLELEPHLKHYLKLNEKRLTTWLDVHSVLVDIAKWNLSAINERGPKRAYSLIREEVPVDRDCKSALIPENYCVCDEQREISVNQSFVKDAAASLISHINDQLRSSIHLCQPLTLSEIKNANVLFKATNFETNDVMEDHKIEIVIVAKPSNALFSGQLLRNWDSSWTVIGDVSRINAYGNQSLCIRDKVLRKYCYCYNLSPDQSFVPV